MAAQVEFSTVPELFEKITTKFAGESRPMFMHKLDGVYAGISYTEMRSRVHDFALGLASLGLKRGDHAAIVSENRPEWVVADLAIVSLGGIDVPLYPTLSPKQIEYILADAGVRHIIVSNRYQLSKIEKALSRLPSVRNVILLPGSGGEKEPGTSAYTDVLAAGREFARMRPGYVKAEQGKAVPGDLLTIIYTSGTTGNPKGVMLTHDNLASNIKAAARCIPFSPDDILLSFLPLCHSYERMAGYYTALACGVTIAFAESIDTVRENLSEVRPTVVTTVPRLFERLYGRIQRQLQSASPVRRKIFGWAISVGRLHASRRRRGSVSPALSLARAAADALVFRKMRSAMGGRIKYFVSGGAALSRELGEFFEAAGIRIIEGYGLTESSPVISVNRLDDYKFGTVGKPIPGVEVKIAPDGEILARGPNIMAGYWSNAAETAEAVDREGWLRTGDVGEFDAGGFLRITDRKKHLFVTSGGKNIAPQPIENLFLQSRYIDQFVLIGDNRMFCAALVVPNFEALKEYARSRRISSSDQDDLIANPAIVGLIDAEIGALQKDLAGFERVRRFCLLGKPMTIEGGELTPTMKVRRSVVEEKFKSLINRMYDEIR